MSPPNVEEYVEKIKPFIDAGFTEVALVRIGADQQKPFFEWAEKNSFQLYAPCNRWPVSRLSITLVRVDDLDAATPPAKSAGHPPPVSPASLSNDVFRVPALATTWPLG